MADTKSINHGGGYGAGNDSAGYDVEGIQSLRDIQRVGNQADATVEKTEVGTDGEED